MFGYAIALAGLIYYKIGGEQAQATYMKLTKDENSAFNRFRRSLWAKVGAGLLLIFVVLAIAHGFTRGIGVDTAMTSTGLTGAPEPEMVDAYSGEGFHTDEIPGNWDTASSITHYAEDLSLSHPLDVVIYVPATSHNATISQFEQVLALPTIASLNPHVIVYSNSHIAEIRVNELIPLGQIRSASAAYLDYISSHFEDLAQHTMFLHSDVDVSHIMTTVENRFTSQSGVVELSQGGYGVCICTDCVDVFQTERTHLSKTDELYALTTQNICSPTDQLLVTQPRSNLTHS